MDHDINRITDYFWKDHRSAICEDLHEADVNLGKTPEAPALTMFMIPLTCTGRSISTKWSLDIWGYVHTWENNGRCPIISVTTGPCGTPRDFIAAA